MTNLMEETPLTGRIISLKAPSLEQTAISANDLSIHFFDGAAVMAGGAACRWI